MSRLNLFRSLDRSLLSCSLLNLLLVLGGCVGIDDYRAAKRDAEGLGLQLQMEQRRAQELDGKVHQLNEKVRDLERTAQAALEEAARREREYKEIRDELLRFKIPLEQQRVSSQRSRAREGTAKQEPESGSSPAGLVPTLPQASTTDDSKRRLKQALQELQKLLDAD